MNQHGKPQSRQFHEIACTALKIAVLFALSAVTDATANNFLQPTYSSPIALSLDGRLLWSVNPGDDSVSVLRTDKDRQIRKIKVGDEPQGVALDPRNEYALRWAFRHIPKHTKPF